jgi:hypothetical protein
MVKNIFIAIIAIIITVALFSLILAVMKLAFSVLFNIGLLVVIAIFAFPIYVILKKKVFRNRR